MWDFIKMIVSLVKGPFIYVIDLFKRVSDLEQVIKQILEQISDIENKQSHLGERMASLETKIGRVNTDFASIEGDVERLKRINWTKQKEDEDFIEKTESKLGEMNRKMDSMLEEIRIARIRLQNMPSFPQSELILETLDQLSRQIAGKRKSIRHVKKIVGYNSSDIVNELPETVDEEE